MKTFNLYDKVYRIHHRLIICTQPELLDYVKKHRLYDANLLRDDAGGYCIKVPFGVLVWLLQFDLSDINNVCTLTHELIHAAAMVLDDRGVEYGNGSGAEALTYYVEFLQRHFLKALIKA